MKILSLSGFVPEQICDTVRFTQYEGERTISHYCGYASDFISQVMNDASIDGAVFPKSCDSTRVISSYLAECGKFLYQIPVPCGESGNTEEYLALCIKQYQAELERFFNISITDIEKRALFINERNEKLRQLYNKLGDSILYSEYLKDIHKMLQKPLYDQRIETEEKQDGIQGKRVYIVGSFLSNHTILESIEKAGMNIVGDNLPESKRLIFAPEVSVDGDIYKNIAKSMLTNHRSPTQNRFSEIILNDIDEIKKKEAAGVIYIAQKYCEPYDYLYYNFKKKMDEINVPILKIDFANSADNRRIEFELEAFSDLI